MSQVGAREVVRGGLRRMGYWPEAGYVSPYSREAKRALMEEALDRLSEEELQALFWATMAFMLPRERVQ
ncbi:MAG: hypothetical protein DRI81_16340 [Chloroflexi bacterium]|nr:MAG: hypothetical protein DRI81_16340 [Chloroflexota bacterium]